MEVHNCSYVVLLCINNFLIVCIAKNRENASLNTEFDETGSIGKRYRRQDEIGTPFCITYDFDTENDGCVTVRDRDSMEQVRIPVAEVKSYIAEKIKF